ncbi:iron-containing alcohol dehydrogenase [Mobilitalea sibirica]|uniref:Iron-containing alcohol dehydrogenase n=1 Tax=Mobilitalea sibirica TaxID=1462919 RepID=A0A8J7KSQ0_9FIRM|nr:iron-containing alcohol dehydrogenase family protein [Mobilitalea sibirica]MBH1940521.1 iron-containing alcohol dehydrogenase [Mobilitalea sibirica]
MDINFFMPTKVVQGKNCIEINVDLFRSFGTKALIVTGKNSARLNGSQRDITKALDIVGISYTIFDKVMSNPTVDCVFEGAELAKEQEVDFIIGIGGGSPMDAAKAIALLATQNITEEDLFQGKYETKALPLVMVPTTAGTGSEVTQYSILTNDRAKTKQSIATSVLFPKLSFLDAKYMKDLSMEITINTALDALSHSIEGMLSIRSTDLTDSLAVESILKLSDSLSVLKKAKEEQSPQIPEKVREQLLYGSMLAGIVIAHTGTTAVHSMGYSLTYFRNIDHGRANALLLPGFLKFIEKSDFAKVKTILTAMKLNSNDELDILFHELLGERETLTPEEIKKFSGIAIQAKNIQNSKIIPTQNDLEALYTQSLS